MMPGGPLWSHSLANSNNTCCSSDVGMARFLHNRFIRTP
jgi:hypothetical protein